jgi:hypothetical protein
LYFFFFFFFFFFFSFWCWASHSLLGGAHGRKEQHLFDVLRVGKEHGHAIDANAPSGSGRKTVFQRLTKHFVNHLRLVVASTLVRRLLLKSLSATTQTTNQIRSDAKNKREILPQQKRNKQHSSKKTTMATTFHL